MKIDELIKKDFSGCISVVKNAEVVFEKSYGFADYYNEIPNQLNTKFPTASAGKFFVAIGILQLVERGQLTLEHTIGELLELDLRQIDKEITIRQLLNHTSGIPDYFDESTMSEYADLWKDFPNYRIRQSSDLVPLFIDKAMMFKAGEKFQYNNTGFVVLGLIIERVTGQLFDEYLKANVFLPSGMIDTGYYELDRLPKNCANAYIFDENKNEFYTNIFSVDAKGTGAGGAFTTVLDINKFWLHLIDGSLISHKSLNKMFSIQSYNGYQNYGYGVWLDKTEDGYITPYFQGSDPGVSFISSYNLKNDIIFTAVSNFACDVWDLRRAFVEFEKEINF
ncbi:serine hydrolase domain-containing protein [Fundicoccus sp. Sow4_H7]|uniref:serine hydrolase domain-containing protein n=1 Tax=Fundicoccus sp. Sow4_H7 TaxID=3438784 RepID=UPI003F91C360